MQIKTIDQPEVWNKFFNDNESPSFLQSWEWGEFEKRSGYEVLRLGIYDQKANAETHSNASLPTAIALVIKIKAKRGNFLFIPHGPVFKLRIEYSEFRIIIKEILKQLIEIAKKEDFSFIRVAPTLLDIPENLKIFSGLGFRKAPIYMHAERLWVLPLVETHSNASLQKNGEDPSKIRENPKSEIQLLREMRKTTRYLIRKAEREGVTIETRTDDKAVDDFWEIYEKTAEREKFVPFSKQFIKDEFSTFHNNENNNAIFLFGSVPATSLTPEVQGGAATIQNGKNNIYLAAALIIFSKSTAFYHQGASVHSKIPVTYALQWEAIKAAKKRSCRYYNFWGTLQAGRTPKNWGGLTLFKTGFGGNQVDYLPTQDYIVSPKYYLTYLYERYLGWRRGV
ncbi:hypothetical protein A2774_01390 [Candidatus Roizmanbacteria bacterium RIFCSPHIGHO2_01_FULL_39_12c]|uniref:BioF2-like acetyltransferase domain-containing protein n=1 Tax=Candidatus Roizmanbacteria bacterium RIFCSPHIGHO2_01_FULL_39_12c TaxID=1802031 RepID=A0A1F7G8D3_9BACT|nr:MAG: hypothetical protein A2774_01390 [Candidatus Roizmanbacteria bacterium RIFCSPHIGHO2_01_FULL_39_12c]OGK46561.1 MAG: hypothetical protein A2963_02400 [Candidatus Roizmanbacteria bacterium RIFCSPLOWO2_01_FULL_40_13]